MKAYTKSLLPLFFSEMAGTALLLAFGLSAVIFCWGTGSPVARWIPGEPLRRAVTGFLFGCVGCLVTISPVGKISGAHINPAVTLAFWANRKMKTHAMFGYMASQMVGAVLGCLPLLLWGSQGKSVKYGITFPANGQVAGAFFGEVITTACLIGVIFWFVRSKSLRDYTPFTMPLLYGLMVWAEGSLSGCSTNPARSFGPALVSFDFRYYWLYLTAPLLAAIGLVALYRALHLHHQAEMESARVSYHGSKTHESIRPS
ncbi:MAG TPA: MIP/aquaporin family protein [Chitinophagaceae bacterium]|nr:MIP/aquaporin family protein [Chitinophagaceae bacterium]